MESFVVKALLDTHAIIWIAESDPRLGAKAREFAKDCSQKDLAVADISLLEIAMLWHKKRIPSKEPLSRTLAEIELNFRVLPINSMIASEAYHLPLPQADPFDRIIVATAKYHQLQLITKDNFITESHCVDVIW